MSAEWAEAAAPLTKLLPDIPGAKGTVSFAVSGGRRQEAGFHWIYKDGVAAAGEAGSDASADLVLLLASEDALDMVRGDVEPSVSFMRGRLKASGDGALLLGFLKSTTGTGFIAWREKVASLAAETAR
ncbi:MAG TPA: SCP2 sterol-binding domain-containing protein [Acidimicrobiales bacterium]|nr:SCP2 sterol-binding domain-containing protein [Acidimicrobiales bacterium]